MSNDEEVELRHIPVEIGSKVRVDGEVYSRMSNGNWSGMATDYLISDVDMSRRDGVEVLTGTADPMVEVILFKPSGKYYTTDENWRIPQGAIGPHDMIGSPDFRRIDGGAVLIPEQEPWGYPHLFPGEK